MTSAYSASSAPGQIIPSKSDKATSLMAENLLDVPKGVKRVQELQRYPLSSPPHALAKYDRSGNTEESLLDQGGKKWV